MIKSKEELVRLADKVRRRLGYDLLGPVSFSDLCDRDKTITVVMRPFSDKTSGMCIKDGGGHGIIAVNSNQNFGRQRFTFAHELYHFYYSTDLYIVCDIDEEKSRNDEETNANRFAAWFLMPDASFHQVFEERCNSQVTLENILLLENYFQVSRKALLSRLRYEKILTESDPEKYITHIRVGALEHGYPDTLYISSSSGQSVTYGRYVALVNELYSKELISKEKRDNLLLDAYRDDIVFPSGDNK